MDCALLTRGLQMKELVFLGAACVVAAVIGGGLKWAGMEIPVLQSAKRQVLLAVVGCLLIAGGVAPMCGGLMRLQIRAAPLPQRSSSRRQNLRYRLSSRGISSIVDTASSQKTTRRFQTSYPRPSVARTPVYSTAYLPHAKAGSRTDASTQWLTVTLGRASSSACISTSSSDAIVSWSRRPRRDE